MTKPTKPYKRKGDPSRRMKAAKILKERAEGKSFEEIGAEMGMARQTVSRILTQSEAEQIVKTAESDTTLLVQQALDRVREVINDREDNTNALKACLAVLKSKGVIRDTVDVTHHMPVPTVIRHNGKDQVTLGAKSDDPDEDSG